MRLIETLKENKLEITFNMVALLSLLFSVKRFIEEKSYQLLTLRIVALALRGKNGN